MISSSRYSDGKDVYEYHGSTIIERVRMKGDITVCRDWLIFDSVEEAFAYYNDNSPD